MGNIDTGKALVTPREMAGEMMRLMVDSIVEELQNNEHLASTWDALDEDVRDEITEECCEIINSCWLRGCP